MATLTGRALVAAMCRGQVGNLLPHVVVPAIMAQHLMPLWGLGGAEAGLMASAYAFGYMLAVPVLTTLTDRIDARKILLAGSAASALQARAGAKKPARFPAGAAQSHGARLHPRLWRALLRALRHAHLDRAVL